MPRERRHLAGVTWEGGLVVLFFFFLLSRECSLGAHGLLRFRTNDVLLGTSGVGCAYLWCLIPSVMCYGYRFAEWTLLQPFDLRLPTSAGRLPMVEWLPGRIGDYDPYNFFHTWRAQFLLRCTSEFELASSRLALGVRPFFVTGDSDVAAG